MPLRLTAITLQLELDPNASGVIGAVAFQRVTLSALTPE